MPTLDESQHASDHETWTAYWKQCRILNIWHKDPDYTDEFNPLWIRYREIPEGEDVTVSHPEIPVSQIETPLNTECYRALIDSLPKDHLLKSREGIEKATAAYHNSLMKQEKDFAEYLEYKKQGDLRIETVDDTKPISWESIRNATTEELFQTKLEIFESPPVQECENKEYRSNIRKSASIIEAMYWYYLIVSGVAPKDGTTEEIIPEDVNVLLEDIPTESIFKWKLQLFERENVQNSENKTARSKIRKATNLVDLFSAYAELDKKE